MAGMTAAIQWSDVALRLAFTVLAALLIGYNRNEHGKVAGLCTTLLVCLAASIAMIQVNILLPTAGKTPDSFVTMDLMRLPLGILTGMGFIGGGVILRRRDNIVVGVTTAATLWFVTVIGLCFGGGQIELGLIATALGLCALWILKSAELRLRQEQPARLTITLDANGPSEEELRRRLHDRGLSVIGSSVLLSSSGGQREMAFELRSFRYPSDTATPTFVQTLASEAGVMTLQWRTPS